MGAALGAYIFNIGACVDSDHITMLHSEIVSNDPVDSGTTIIEIVVGENDKNGVLPLLSTDEDCVATEQLELLHGVVGERNDGVIIVGGISNPTYTCISQTQTGVGMI